MHLLKSFIHFYLYFNPKKYRMKKEEEKRENAKGGEGRRRRGGERCESQRDKGSECFQ
jgi:hypothetical protein